MRCFYAKTPNGIMNGIGCSRTRDPFPCHYRQAARNPKLRGTFAPEFFISEMQVLCACRNVSNAAMQRGLSACSRDASLFIRRNAE